MVKVMAVTFKKYGQLHYLDPGGEQYSVGDMVLYPTQNGPEVAQCVWAPEDIEAEKLVDLPKCLGKASEADIARDKTNSKHRYEAQQVAKKLIVEHKLPMKVVGVDYLDNSDEYDRMIVIYFTAPHRVDFRGLLVDLAKALSARIDLRQVAQRDVARLIGGIGTCGRELCCTSFLAEFEPINSRLVKVQGLPVNPLQISGMCGRLRCCLRFEHQLYVDFLRKAPSVGSKISCAQHEGEVVELNVPSESVKIRDSSGELFRCPIDAICKKKNVHHEAEAG